jgi:hypothetical protein
VGKVYIAATDGVILALVKTLESTDEVKRLSGKKMLGLLAQNPACSGLL